MHRIDASKCPGTPNQRYCRLGDAITGVELLLGWRAQLGGSTYSMSTFKERGGVFPDRSASPPDDERLARGWRRASSPSHRNPPHAITAHSPISPNSTSETAVENHPTIRTALEMEQNRITAMERQVQRSNDALKDAGNMLEAAERAAQDAEVPTVDTNPPLFRTLC